MHGHTTVRISNKKQTMPKIRATRYWIFPTESDPPTIKKNQQLIVTQAIPPYYPHKPPQSLSDY
jgi:hypothetical protein